MTDNEKLIEEAAITIREADGALSHGDAVLYAEAALTVFENAHTPTDTERLDIISAASAAFKARGGAPDWEEDAIARDLIIRWHLRGFEDGLAAGFRRSEVPEPNAVKAYRALDKADPHVFDDPDARDAFEFLKAAVADPQGEPSDARHAEHATVEWAYESDCLEGECAHRDEDGEPEDMSVCPTVPPFEVCVGCMEDEGRGSDPEHWDDVPLMPWPCPAALRAAGGVR